MEFSETDDYVWENHVVGRIPLKEPKEPEIIFHNQLWQDEYDADSESMSEDDYDDESMTVEIGDDVTEGIKDAEETENAICKICKLEITSNGTCSKCQLSRPDATTSELDSPAATVSTQQVMCETQTASD